MTDVGSTRRRDATWLFAGQGVRAAGYGFTAVLLGASLATSGYSHLRAGVLMAVIIGGTAFASLVVGAFADRVGRRASYAIFFVGIAVAGAIFASGAPFWLMLVLASTGTLSTDVVDNGPATTLEQVMLADDDRGSAVVYGWYNSVGAVAGAVGALGATLPGVQRPGAAGVHVWLFAVLIPVGVAGALIATRLSPAVEISAGPDAAGRRLSLRLPLGPSRRVVHRLAVLFAVDAAGGGLVTTGFLSYFFVQRYHASIADLGWLFFTVSLIQAISVRLAPVIARRIGLVATMVGTHLPSNVLLLAVAFAPTLPIAVGLLLARTTLSQMDVPTRQALVMTVVMPEERTVAAAVTNSARYAVRPAGPVIGGVLQQLSLGAPLVVAGLVKAAYDVALWRWARYLPPVSRGAITGPDRS